MVSISNCHSLPNSMWHASMFVYITIHHIFLCFANWKRHVRYLCYACLCSLCNPPNLLWGGMLLYDRFKAFTNAFETIFSLLSPSTIMLHTLLLIVHRVLKIWYLCFFFSCFGDDKTFCREHLTFVPLQDLFFVILQISLLVIDFGQIHLSSARALTWTMFLLQTQITCNIAPPSVWVCRCWLRHSLSSCKCHLLADRRQIVHLGKIYWVVQNVLRLGCRKQFSAKLRMGCVSLQLALQICS